MLERKTSYSILAAVVILAVIFLIAAFSNNGAPPGASEATLVPVGKPLYAPPGMLAVGFPKQLLIDGNAQITTSYLTLLGGGGKNYAAVWDSSSSPDAIAIQYVSLLNSEGWNATLSPVVDPSIREVSAENASGTVLVHITAEDGYAEVKLNYSTQ